MIKYVQDCIECILQEYLCKQYLIVFVHAMYYTPAMRNWCVSGSSSLDVLVNNYDSKQLSMVIYNYSSL